MSQYELVLLSGGKEHRRFPITEEGLVIGRSSDADVRIDGQTVSRRHARIYLNGVALSIEDLGSRNGVKIDGARVTQASLKEGDRFAVGEIDFVVEAQQRSHVPKPAINGKLTKGSSSAAAASNGAVAGGAAHPSPLARAAQLSSLVSDASQLYKEALKTLVDAVSARRGFLFGASPASAEPKMMASYSCNGGPEGPPLNRLMVEHALRKKKIMLRLDGKETVSNRSDVPKVELSQWLICVPLIGASECMGVIYADTAFGKAAFDKDCFDLCVSIGRMAGEAIEKSRQVKMH